MKAMLAAAWLCTVCAGQFPVPASPAIPAKITVPLQEVCTSEQLSGLAQNDWKGHVSREGESTVFTQRAWGPQMFYARLDAPLFALSRGQRYEVSYELKVRWVDDSSAAALAEDPGLMLYKESSTYATKDYVWPTNFTQDKPEEIIGGAEIPFAPAAAADGYTKYTAAFVAATTVANPTQRVWAHHYLAVRPNKEVAFLVRNFCVRRPAVEVDAPTAPARYSEKFVPLVPPRPSDAELMAQSACPFDEAGLVPWADVVGTPAPTSGTVTLPENKKVLVNRASFPPGARFEKIEVPATSELVFADEEISLNVKALLVKGKLRIGSETCRMQGPIKVVFWGAKSDPWTDLEGYGSKGLAVVGQGEADVFGRRYYPTWGRLARTARAGDDRVYLQERVNWLPGQEVVVLTTVWDDTDVGTAAQNEVRTVKAVADDGAGSVVQLDTELAHLHYGGAEYQGEVALLSRNVVFEGEPDSDGYGGHTVVAGKRGRFAGVGTRYMGQTNRIAKYPFHLHLLQGGSGSYFSDNCVRDSYFRCFTVHGTHDAVINENVAFNASGSCFYLEDGVEENNTYSYNIAAHVKPIGDAAAGNGQAGETFLQDKNPGGLTSGDRLQPADASATCFYFSNAYNTIVGNVASGGWAGFGFPGFPRPIGEFKDLDFEPQARPTKEFRGNTAHSAGWYWGRGGAVYIGGQLTYEDDAKTKLKWLSGRESRNTRLESTTGFKAWEGTPLTMTFLNTRIYASNKGLLHWGARVDIDGFEMHDVTRSVTLFGEAWLGNGIINGESNNVEAGYATRHHDGFQFYDISVKSVVTGIEFRNYNKGPCYRTQLAGQGVNIYEPSCNRTKAGGHYNIIWSGLYHSDEFKPQQISGVNNIRYTNVDKSLLVSIKIVESGASRFFNFVDFDGSATQENRPTIVGSNLNWWRVCDDCRYEDLWDVYLCPKKPAGFEEREVAHIKIRTPDIWSGGIQRSGSCKPKDAGAWDWSNCNVGTMSLWGHGPAHGDEERKTIITSNEGVTGLTGTGWYMWLDKGAAKKLTIKPEQIPNNATLRFATSYPKGTKFDVTAAHQWDSRFSRTYTLAASADEVWADPQSKYYFDDATGVFYMQPKMPYEFDRNAAFERGGARVYDTETFLTITIVADCNENSDKFCSTKPTKVIPAWTGGCPVTAAPATSTPDTDAPATQVPDTDVPNTSAPATDAPATNVPDTLTPGETRAPDTDAPDTAVPDTMAPLMPGETRAPDTDAPDTAVPDTMTPLKPGETRVPDTDAPDTDAPDTLTPLKPGESRAPDTDVPDTAVPDTLAPLKPGESRAPATAVPDTLSPLKPGESRAPETQVPSELGGPNGAGEQEEDDSSSSNWWVYLLIAGGALLCLGATAAGVLHVQRKQNTTLPMSALFESQDMTSFESTSPAVAPQVFEL